MISTIIEIAAFVVFVIGMFTLYVPFGFMCTGVFLYVIALFTRPETTDEDETE